MRKLNILKAILDFFWFFTIIGAVGSVIFLLFYLFGSIVDIPIKIKGQEITTYTFLSKTIVFVNVVGSYLFLYSIYLLRKVVGLFQKREIFNEEVVRSFSLIGQLIIISSLISNVSLFIYKIVEKGQVYLTLDLGSYDSFLISISLGLFFMVISTIFKIATNLKKENDLTI
ncbi:DUF2975 domain-containing protein [uncultured Flavobacterium sp.]|uniref:DUF2975 domain-containing protein n=1 Tax=uncultured Flavobacterium sp. TaxID=165435 RepID=UPI0030CA47E7